MLTLKQIDQRLKTISKSYGTINDKVQECAVAIVYHANSSNDCHRAKLLVRTVPAKMRGLLRTWFAEVSPINVSMGKTAADDKVSLRKEGKKNFMPFDIDKAKANLWYEDPFKSDEAPELNTIQTYYDSFERLFDRMEKDTKDDAGKIVEGDIASVQALRAAIRASFVEYHAANPVIETTDAEEQDETVPAGMVAAA